MRCLVFLFFIHCIFILSKTSLIYGSLPERELDSSYWLNLGVNDINAAKSKFDSLNTNVAKNVILFIGDGMSLGTAVAGRMLKGQRSEDGINGKVMGEETMTSLDELPHLGILKPYSVNYQTPDGASTATAILCGVKTKSGLLGVSARSKPKNCESIKGNELESILKLSAQAGKSTGIVTTSQVQEPTVAAAYANSPHRNWYSDKDVPQSQRACKDISQQLVGMGTDLNVVLGGGRVHMRPYGTNDEEYKTAAMKRGNRRDGKNLIADWLDDKPPGTAKYVWNKEEFDKINPETTDYILGLFEPFAMIPALNKKSSRKRADEPSLSEMVIKAIKVLEKNPNGYFLLVESGLIDKSHHQSKAHYALQEFLELEKAIQISKNLTNEEDTLIVATADHGHLFNIGGGTTVRGNPILGLSSNHSSPKRATDKKYYTSILYGNGPGIRSKQDNLPELNLDKTVNKKYSYQGVVPMSKGTHSAEDVIALASGPMAHLIHGVHEQSFLAHVMMYASCVGDNLNHCYGNLKKGSVDGDVIEDLQKET